MRRPLIDAGLIAEGIVPKFSNIETYPGIPNVSEYAYKVIQQLKILSDPITYDSSTDVPPLVIDTETSPIEISISSSNSVSNSNNNNDHMNNNEIITVRHNRQKRIASPRKGSDIFDGLDPNLELLNCRNQSDCIITELQLQPKFNVYMCNHVANHGIRFYYLIEEGINLHPNIKVVKNINEADYVIYLPGSAPWHLTECTSKNYISKLIVLDEFDGYPLYAPYNNKVDMMREYGDSMVWYNSMYKRAYTSRKDGNHMDYPHLLKDDVYPLTYSVAEEYARDVFNKNREIEIMCTLRGHKKMSTRQVN